MLAGLRVFLGLFSYLKRLKPRKRKGRREGKGKERERKGKSVPECLKSVYEKSCVHRGTVEVQWTSERTHNTTQYNTTHNNTQQQQYKLGPYSSIHWLLLLLMHTITLMAFSNCVLSTKQSEAIVLSLFLALSRISVCCVRGLRGVCV